MKNSRLAVAFAAAILALAASRTGATAEKPMPLMAPEASAPAACNAENKQAKKCMRWYELNEKASPDACKAARLSGEKCGRWYSVGAPAPKIKEEVIVLRGINFDTAKADIKPESVPILEKNVANLNKRPKTHITIEGHTDARGSDTYNQGLSERRANSVLNWFAAHGVDRDRMSAVGKGESMPVADNKTADGMYQNRRIEIHMQ
ncbi:MAG TPA: OmpA family protein [bacterium]|nr:OmpA family protein [bacterium]